MGHFLFIQLSQVTLITLTQAGPRLAPSRSTSSPSQLATGKFVWVAMAFLYLDTLGMAMSAWTASFIPTMKVRKYLSSFMALPINGEASYHQRIKISNEIVQWKLCLLN